MFGSEEYEDSKDDEDSEGILKENRQKTETPVFDGTKGPEEGRDTVLLTDLGTEESKNYTDCVLWTESLRILFFHIILL